MTPKSKPNYFCMAPWTHTYLSPQTERRLCCASREPAQNFKQYIDTSEGSNTYEPMKLSQWWNSKFVKGVRKDMMEGRKPAPCEVCNEKLLNTDVYRDYFWHMFKHKYDDVWENTDSDGYTTMQPVSWDYRFSNLCNFKCRTCGDMLSSSWESEQRKHGMTDYTKPKNHWMKPDVRKQISQFQDSVVEKEFSDAVENHNVEEVYWVGGEPLMYEQHWRYMKRIVELGDGPNLYARYNTNLSRIKYKGIDLYHDILANIRDWEICASIDGTGKTGEYIRTGLDYDQWLENYKKGVEFQNKPNQMRLDFTLTLPGLFEIERMFDLSVKTNTMLLSKVTFTFSPDIYMSPLFLPKHILHSIVEPVIAKLEPKATWKQQSLIDVLKQLLNRPTTQEQWSNDYTAGWIKGKKRCKTIELVRKDCYTMDNILEENNHDAYKWWNSIAHS